MVVWLVGAARVRVHLRKVYPYISFLFAALLLMCVLDLISYYGVDFVDPYGEGTHMDGDLCG